MPKPIFILLLITLFACQRDLSTDQYISLENHQEVLRSRDRLSKQVDSLQGLLEDGLNMRPDTLSPYEIAPPSKDSLISELQKTMAIPVEIPLLFTEAIVHPKLMKQFNTLAKSTGGKLTLLAKSDDIASSIREIIEKYGASNLDLMVIMDNTGSMANDIKDVREGLSEILEGLKKYPGARLAFATYGDRFTEPDSWYSFREFDTDYEAWGQYLKELKITGGGDLEESVYDGVYQALEEGFFERRRKRMVILIGDAPGHKAKDKTDKQVSDIISLARSRKLKMNFYPIIIHPGNRSLTGPVKEGKSDMRPLIESVYPNPSSGLFNIRFFLDQEHVVEVFNQDAKLVQKLNYKGKELRIKLERPQPGLYTLRVRNAKGKYDLSKLIIQ